ncbi:MAG: 50S ribosome-binding GTPase [Anaerolineae bacterium]|nr:50S ribosome-binding GTPase [Anaerolineae bacterium]
MLMSNAVYATTPSNAIHAVDSLHAPPSLPQTVVMVGLESSGKSALFRQLTGHDVGDESNFRGSTIQCRVSQLHQPDKKQNTFLVDTPGIRLQSDSATTQMALKRLQSADVVLLVVRGTHFASEFPALLAAVGGQLLGKSVTLVVTFADRADPALSRAVKKISAQLGWPAQIVNARDISNVQRAGVLASIALASVVQKPIEPNLPALKKINVPIVQPKPTVFEIQPLGVVAAVIAIVLMFALPVMLAYWFSQWAQPLIDDWAITPLVNTLSASVANAPLLQDVLVGRFGVITLGWYSFLWAFPVVVLLGISVALSEETGLKDHITSTLDMPLRRIGLSGRDLIPVLTGFGCNVVGVMQSRACSACTRKSCVSLIGFGSACSYQIGASLSLFGSAEAPHLFVPYLGLLFIVGALHTRFWHGALPQSIAQPLPDRAFLQWPSFRALIWRLMAVTKQFLFQAMPIFLLICVVAALVQSLGWLDWISSTIGSALIIFNLPDNVAIGVIFSAVRKDGLLLLNQDDGVLLRSLSAGSVFVLVWLSSTLTACMVTLYTVMRELGAKFAALLALRQLATALVSTLIISWVVRLF